MGEHILPPVITQTPHVLSALMDEEGRARSGVRNDRVYVATQYEAAALFAALFPGGGWVYLVLPERPLEAAPDCTDTTISLACPRARVLEVHQLHPDDVLRILKSTPGGGTP
ncbi:MAG: hypothetical protein ABW123_26635 [Cystobacter sp.]